MKDKLEAVPNTESIERKDDKNPSWIKKPEVIGWGMFGIFIISCAAILVFVALRYRYHTAETFPPWVSFLSASILSLLLLAVVIAQAYIYHLQRKAMLGQLDAMQDSLTETRNLVAQNERAIAAAEANVETVEKTAIYANRAYVTAKIRDVNEVEGHVKFRLRIENSGNTPANNVSISYAFKVLDKPPHTEQPNGLVVSDIGFTETERLGVIAPHGSYHVIKTPSITLNPAEIVYWRKRELKAYCWGRITYEDIFNDVRYTDFCFVQSDEHRTGYPCKHGNEAN